MPKKRTLAVIGVATALITLSACGSSGAGGSGGSNSTIALGLSADFSGPLSAYGLGWRAGAQAYIGYINSQGGVDGHKLKYIALDDGSDASRAAANATQLVTSDHVAAIASPLSNTCVSIVPIAQPKKVPVICNGLTSDLLDPPQPGVYSEALLFSEEVGPMEQVAEKALGSSPKSVAIYYENTAANQPEVDAFKASFKKKGIPVVATESVPLSSTNVSAQAAKIAAAKPDVIFAASSDQSSISLARALHDMNFNAPIISHAGSGVVALKSLKLPNFYNMQFVAIGDSPAYETFAKILKDNGADPTATFAGQGYLQAMIAVDALKKCGYPCDDGKLDAAMNDLTVNTDGFTSGPVQFSSDRHEGIQAMFAYQWDSAKNEPVIFAQDLKAGNG